MLIQVSSVRLKRGLGEKNEDKSKLGSDTSPSDKKRISGSSMGNIDNIIFVNLRFQSHRLITGRS